jgi:hypothetical protein
MENKNINAFSVVITNKGLDSATLPTELKILNYGVNETIEGDIIVNDDTLKYLKERQYEMGREEVPIDWEHSTVPGTVAYKESKEPRSVAGYATPEARSDGIWLTNIKWTPDGEKKAKNYIDLSPAVKLDKNKVVESFHSVALTKAGAVYGLHFYSVDENLVKKNNNNNKTNKLMPMTDTDALKTIDELEKHETDEIVHKEDCNCNNCLSVYLKNFAAELAEIKSHIKNEEKTKTLSVDSVPNAYKNTAPATTTQTEKYMFDQLKAISPEKLGMKTDEEILEILKSLVAKWEGVDGVDGPITNKENSKFMEFSAKLNALETEIKAFSVFKNGELSRRDEIEKQEIVAQSTREGKVIPLSADSIKSTPVEVLKEIVNKLPKNVVPTKSTMKVLSTENAGKKATLTDAARLIDERVAEVMAR